VYTKNLRAYSSHLLLFARKIKMLDKRMCLAHASIIVAERAIEYNRVWAKGEKLPQITGGKPL
jgi:hypothetical protein